MNPSYIIFGLTEICAGFLFSRHQDDLLGRLGRAWKPLPADKKRDRLLVALVGPFVIGLGVVTVLIGVL